LTKAPERRPGLPSPFERPARRFHKGGEAPVQISNQINPTLLIVLVLVLLLATGGLGL